MIAVKKNTTLSEIVIENPIAAKIFHNYNLDFCCGGKQSLESACKAKNLESELLLSQLKDLGKVEAEEFDVNENTQPTEVIDYILKRFHEVHRGEFSNLLFLAEKVSRVHGYEHPELAQIHNLVKDLIAELESHMEKEEKVLFPMIQVLELAAQNGETSPQLHCGNISNPIYQMEAEHNEVGHILKTIRSLSSGFALPAGACNSYRAYYAGLEKLEFDLHLHIHYENNVLHPMAKKI